MRRQNHYLFLLKLNDGQWDYDLPRAVIVAAPTHDEARRFVAKETGVPQFESPEVSTITIIGYPVFKIRKLSKPKIILLEAHEG